MSHDYPWYEVVDGSELQQGDIVIGCPVVVPYGDLGSPLPEEVDVSIEDHDLVVMTQSCDLAQEKVTEVIACPHWDLETAAQMDKALAKKGAPDLVRKGRFPRYLLLNSSDLMDQEMGVRIVDFGRIVSLPKDYLSTFLAGAGSRLRLCPPYREHLAQAFARYFMRVGLPQDIEL